jgi:hypothetical protein
MSIKSIAAKLFAQKNIQKNPTLGQEPVVNSKKKVLQQFNCSQTQFELTII